MIRDDDELPLEEMSEEEFVDNFYAVATEFQDYLSEAARRRYHVPIILHEKHGDGYTFQYFSSPLYAKIKPTA
jgi:hypothetical protein